MTNSKDLTISHNLKPNPTFRQKKTYSTIMNTATKRSSSILINHSNPNNNWLHLQLIIVSISSQQINKTMDCRHWLRINRIKQRKYSSILNKNIIPRLKKYIYNLSLWIWNCLLKVMPNHINKYPSQNNSLTEDSSHFLPPNANSLSLNISQKMSLSQISKLKKPS